MSLKMLREALCKEQQHVEEWPGDIQLYVRHLIKVIDSHRPLDSSGTHGDLHTSTCGCEDK